MPATPSNAETMPSCITPLRRKHGHLLVQRKHASGDSLVLQGLAHPPADRTGTPSSVKPAAPASAANSPSRSESPRPARA